MKNIGTLFEIARDHLLGLLCWTLLGGAAASGVSFLTPVEYEATARVLVVAPYWNDSTAIADPNFGGAVLAYGDEFTQQRVASYARLVETPFVMGPVSQRLGTGISAKELSSRVSTHVVPDTVILEIQAVDGSPTTATRIADETARQLVDAVKALERPPFTRVSPVQPLLVEPADVPTRPVSPRIVLYVASGLLFGFLTGLTVVSMVEGRALAELVDDGVAGENVLGILSATESGGDAVDMDARFAELQINLLRGNPSGPIILVAPRGTPAVLSAARRIAAVMSIVGNRRPVVVIADAFVDTGAAGQPGLQDVAAGSTALDDAIVFEDGDAFDWMPYGGSNTQARPRLDAMSAVIAELAATREVLVVAPAVLESVDVIDLGGAGAATVLVTEAHGTSGSEMRAAEGLLEMGRSPYLGRLIVTTRAFAHHGVAVGPSGNRVSGESWNF